MLSRRILLGSIVAPAVVLAAVSVAWACVPQGTLTLNPTQGAAGTRVMTSGSGFEGSEPIEIRWESRTGPILATTTTTGPSFNNVPITIPASATGGVHYVSAANTGEHADHSATAASFEVTGAAPGPQPPPPPPPPSNSADPHDHGSSAARAKAIKRCKRKYSAKRAKTAAQRRRMAKKRKACLKKAKRLGDDHDASSFSLASLPLFGS